MNGRARRERPLATMLVGVLATAWSILSVASTPAHAGTATLAVVAPAAGLVASTDAAPPPTTPPATEPTTTDNSFIPTERNIGDCLGTLQRPDCGSDDRGGWRQTLVFLGVICGMLIVFWRVSVNVRRNRSRIDREAAGE